MRIRSAVLIGLALFTVGCDQLGIGGPPDDATVEARMETGCGSGARTSAGILDLEIGVSFDRAMEILNCYDPTARLQSGSYGDFATEAKRFLREIAPSDNAYSNILVWTRGEERDCAQGSGGGSNSNRLDESLQPDDLRYAPSVFSGSQFPGWPCFTRVKDQIVLRFGGPPDGLVLIGIWRLSVPRDGHRPRIADLASVFNTRYPNLALDQAQIGESGFSGAAFTDSQGERIEAVQIAADARSLAVPVAPSPPPTTETCYVVSSCPRTPSQAEYDRYQQQQREYEAAQRLYQQRRAAADRFGGCVSNPPRTPGHAPIEEAQQVQCGQALVVAARNYPGGFTEAYFVGIYDYAAATRARLRLEEYIRSRRGQISPTNGNSLPSV